MAENETEVLKVRDIQREIQKDIRREKKEDILNQNRKHLNEVKTSFEIISADEMKELALELVKSKISLNTLHRIKNGAVSGESHIESFLRVHGVIEKLVGNLCGTDAEKQLEAAACVTNLATGLHKSTHKVAKSAGAYLVTYIRGDSHFLQNQCSWAAGNIANDCEKCFSVLNSQGLLSALVPLLDSSYPEVVQSAAFALNACSKYNSPEMQKMVKKKLVPLLIRTLNRNDISHRAIVDTVFSLSNISLQAIEHLSQPELEKLANAVLDLLAKATVDDNIDILLVTPAVRCLGNLSTGPPELCNFILNHKTFKNSIMKVLSSSHQYLQKEMLWVLNNLLNFIDVSENFMNWCWIMGCIQPFLSPLDENAVQALYFLCVLKATKLNFEDLLTGGYTENLAMLCNCGKVEVEIAAKTFRSMPPLSVQTV